MAGSFRQHGVIMAMPQYPRRVFQGPNGQLTETGHKWMGEIVKKFTTIDGAIGAVGSSVAGVTAATTTPGNLVKINSTGDGFADSGIAAADVLTDASLTSSTNFLTGNVALTLADTFYDGPSFSLDAGTWLVSAMITFYNTGVGNNRVTVKLLSGTTPIVAPETNMYASAGDPFFAFALPGIPVVLTDTTTVKIQASCDVTNTSMLATPVDPVGGVGDLTNLASFIAAVKIA